MPPMTPEEQARFDAWEAEMERELREHFAANPAAALGCAVGMGLFVQCAEALGEIVHAAD